jgi:hypothetical protein
MGRLIRAVLLCRFRVLMKSASLISMVFAVSTLLFAQNTKAASTVTAFDGTWSVTGNGHEYINPDGSVTLTWVIHFPAKVKMGSCTESGEPEVRRACLCSMGKWRQTGR